MFAWCSYIYKSSARIIFHCNHTHNNSFGSCKSLLILFLSTLARKKNYFNRSRKSMQIFAVFKLILDKSFLYANVIPITLIYSRLFILFIINQSLLSFLLHLSNTELNYLNFVSLFFLDQLSLPTFPTRNYLEQNDSTYRYDNLSTFSNPRPTHNCAAFEQLKLLLR